MQEASRFATYHDVILFVLQLFCIAPLTALFVEIYNRKGKVRLRDSSVLAINDQIVSIFTTASQAHNSLHFLTYYDNQVALSKFVQDNLQAPLWNNEFTDRFELEKSVFDHNTKVDKFDRKNNDYLNIAIFDFQQTQMSCTNFQEYLVLFASTYDVDEFEKISSIARYVGQIAKNCGQFAFFIDQARHGSLTLAPRIVDYNQVLDEWEQYVDAMGSIAGKSRRMRIVSYVAKFLGHGNIFGSLPQPTKERIKKVIRALKAIGRLKPEDQASIINLIATTDFSSYRKTKIPASTPHTA